MKKKVIEFHSYPSPVELVKWFKKQSAITLPEVNGHIHTPHSFSSFSNIEMAFQLARKEGIEVLGINDFYTTDGYDEFSEMAMDFNLFPLFNIEFMGLRKDLQMAGIRVNDPNNPGRTYFCGKGLRYPVKMSSGSAGKVEQLQKESNRQTYLMVDKLNDFFVENQIDIHFNAAALHKELAKGLFRERHLAQAVRLAVYDREATPEGRRELLEQIFSGKKVQSPPDSIAALENEIRNNLLKAGGAAFVPEDPKAFLSLDELIDIITDAGGIPCYPVLLDNANGNFTEFESDKGQLLQELVRTGVFSVELIPGRNNFEILKDFVTYFANNGFVITFGTEHNTPQCEPLKVSCSGGVPLDEELRQINYEGAAVIAAHQYLIGRGEEGYLKGRIAKTEEREEFVELGKAVIAW